MAVNALQESAEVLRKKLSAGPGIKSTTDYSIFKKHPQNREVIKDSVKFKRLLNSIREDDLLAYRPILVNQDMQVMDGQHRLEAAKELKKTIYYLVGSQLTAEDMRLLNINQSGWRAAEYLNYFAKGGNPEYVEFIQFCEKEGLPIDLGFDIVFPFKKTNANRIMSLGRFVFPKGEELLAVQKLLGNYNLIWNFFREKNVRTPKYLHSKTFKSGIIMFLKENPPDLKLFLSRLEKKMSTFRSCSRAIHYAEQLGDAYNFGAKNKIDFSDRDFEEKSQKSLL